MRKKVIDNLDDNHQYVIGKKVMRRKMNKCGKLVLFSCIVMLICCSMGWATAYEDDSQVESEAQKDMLAYVQSTFS